MRTRSGTVITARAGTREERLRASPPRAPDSARTRRHAETHHPEERDGWRLQRIGRALIGGCPSPQMEKQRLHLIIRRPLAHATRSTEPICLLLFPSTDSTRQQAAAARQIHHRGRRRAIHVARRGPLHPTNLHIPNRTTPRHAVASPTRSHPTRIT